MGRSKFPGKPSKSINRKRISVLQLDDESTTGAASGPPLQQQSQQQQQQQGESTASQRNKGNNCDNNDDDDDNAPNGGVIAGNGSSVTGGISSNGSGSSGGGGSSGSSGGGGVNGANGGNSDNGGHNKSNDCISKAGEAQVDNDNNSIDDDDVDNDIDNDDTAALALSAALLRARKGANKKFKNLNLSRAEVMLPSTSKLKLLNNCLVTSPTITTTTTTSTSTTTTTNTTITTVPAITTTSTITPGGGTTTNNNPFATVTFDSKVVPVDASEDVVAMRAAAVEMPSDAKDTTSTSAGGEPGDSSRPETAAGCSSGQNAEHAPAVVKQKKTVTFKNILETSDDKSAVKRYYNPDNRIPLVSIMKKESLHRTLSYSRGSECIVRPSILSKILNKNSNIDKLNSLKFRTVPPTQSQPPTLQTPSIFAAGLSRAFGAPSKHEDVESKAVTFRLSRNEFDADYIDGDDDDDDDEDDNDNADDDDNNDIDDDVDEDAKDNGEDNDRIEQSVADNLDDKETTPTGQGKGDGDEKSPLMADQHFVLPKRSTRSSRVIKPNKRMLDDGSISKKNTVRMKNYFGLGDTTATTSFTAFGPAKAQLPSSFVLRQPRLQCQFAAKSLSPSTSAMSFGLLSSPVCAICAGSLGSKESSTERKYGVYACDVCRKFLSKMTKKSISVSSTSPAGASQLQCRGNESGCVINYSGKGTAQLKNFKKLYKERCPACWLKKCLVVCQLLAGHKSRLLAILPVPLLKQVEPETKRDETTTSSTATTATTTSISCSTTTTTTTTSSSNNSSSSNTSGIIWKCNAELALNSIKCNPLAENNLTFGSTPLLRPAVLENSLFLKPNDEVKITRKTKQEKQEKQEKQDKLEKERSRENELEHQTKDSPSISVISAEVATAPVVTEPNEKRQRIDLKGPRVKHVCRSASIVLGQPLATFGEEEQTDEKPEEVRQKPEEEESKLPKSPKSLDENENCASCKAPPSPKSKPVATTTALPHVAAKMSTRTVKHLRRETNDFGAGGTSASLPQLQAPHPRRMGKDAVAAKAAGRKKTLISIDFWENYDPAEVCQSGFGLIVTETVAQRALCFLCGSTGLDPLIFCACCCEPYHQYCVLDEYNLKHTSFDDTTLLGTSLLDTSSVTSPVSVSQLNQLSSRLNWLCPRCTVCYTCNMSSGSKVKCQKCQKNYHTTCLGTSKRLLGADRPLICGNCLKCKSCATTKVTKFVGNLPMCTACFKLRKKGNFCPICQRCYDDNDFDLKMMECGDCDQWVHSKCEGLSDEQYNLLSTLPESIEFICKRCARRNDASRQRAADWRHAVMEEFKASLFSVLKLLSKSRQACALLKHSPRKKMRCSCNGNGKLIPKALQFSGEDGLGSDGESQNSDDIYEFKEQPITSQSAFSTKSRNQCSCSQSDSSQQHVQSMAGIGAGSSLSSMFSLVDIKQKISSGSYVSLAEFNYDMSNVIQQSNCDELDIAYKELLSEQFPWFQNETKACTDALEEDMFESCALIDEDDVAQSPARYAAVARGADDTDNDASEAETVKRPTPGMLDIPVDMEEIGCTLRTRIDTRVCLFCRKTGEGLSSEEARLLYCGHDCWAHINCALWSAEVFEEIDGSLQNVHSAVARGRMIKCSVCGNRGATVGCNVKACGEHYHYPCARTIDCAFLTDKSMYCPTHVHQGLTPTPGHPPGTPTPTIENNFEVARPVYVELDRKRKKLIEPSKVQFHIGSLEVRQLGHIVPRFSDSFEAIVPINLLCSRLYWSVKEPWKIVEYTVRTTIQHSYSTLTIPPDAGRHFTVDHSGSNSAIVQLGLAQIALWQESLARSEAMDTTDWSNQPTIGSGNGGESTTVAPDESTEEEPQSNADLLPPEIKDAIFEDLPLELLDGISMLDIFMCEDLGAGDANAVAGTPTNGICDEDAGNSNSRGSFGKQLELSNSWPASNLVEDALLSFSHGGHPSSGSGGAVKQRAKTTTPKACVAAMKRRKLSKGLTEGLLLSLNQQRSKKEMATVAGVSRRQSVCAGDTATAKSFTWSAAKRYFEKGQCDGEASKMKIMQMDGVDDSIAEFRIIGNDGGLSGFTGQVKCERCQCTYRNYESFQRHLPSCEPMSTSESDSESVQQIQQQPTSTADVNFGELQKQAQAQAVGMPAYLQATTTAFPQMQGLATLGQFGLQGLQLQPQTLGNGFFLSPANAAPATSTATDELQLYASSLQSLAANLGGGFALTQPVTPQAPQLIALSTQPDGTQQFIQLPQGSQQQLLQAPTAATIPTTYQTTQDKKILLPMGTGKPIKTVTTKAASQQAKQKQLKAAQGVKPIQAKLSQPVTVPQTASMASTQQLLGQNMLQTQLLFQPNAAAGTVGQQTPSLLLPQQSAPAQNIISFVTTNDGGQNQLQYISIPTANDYKTPAPQPHPTLLTANANQLLQSTTFLQTDASGNLVLTTAPASSGLQMLATAPLQPQPQVIGTLIQPQTLQLDGTQVATTGLEFGHAAPQVILASQPMYYGLETIVQNTVMSSQQFVSTAMPGMLSQNASFSATTTQVFQASKIEPIVDIPAGYVVLNNAVDASNNAGSFLLQANQPQPDDSTATSTAQLFQFQQQQQQQPRATVASMDYANPGMPVVVTAKVPPVAQVKRAGNTVKAPQVAGLSKVQTQQVVNKVLPTAMAMQLKPPSAVKTSTTTTMTLAPPKSKSVAGSTCGAPPSIASKPLQKKTNLIRPIHKVEVKPKVMKPTASVKLTAPVLQQHQLQLQQQTQMPVAPPLQQPQIHQPQHQLHQLQQQQPQQQQQHQFQAASQIPVMTISSDAPYVVEQQGAELVLCNGTGRSVPFATVNGGAGSLPTNIVNPLQQQPAPVAPPSTVASSISGRPTNRVLPMQQRQESTPLVNDAVVPPPTPPKPLEQVSQVSPSYETALKQSNQVDCFARTTTTATSVEELLTEEHQEANFSESLYEKQCTVGQAELDSEKAVTDPSIIMLMETTPCQQQLEAVCFEAMDTADHSTNYVNGDEKQEENSCEDATCDIPACNDDEGGDGDTEDQNDAEVDDDDDDFSLKISTSAGNAQDMSDSEEPAVKEKISKILDNLTNDDCADSITTATTVEASAGYHQMQMVEDVLTTTATAEVASKAFEATLEETAAVEAAASYINKMAEAHEIQLKLLQAQQQLKKPSEKSIDVSTEALNQELLTENTTVAPPQKPPPIREPKKISGPHLLYEIQSEDGFTYKSTSIAEIWEKVFEAVQVARRAHGLTPLPEGPLADMSGIQMIGLKTNALKYLIEQLPGVEKCNKYTPKYHNRKGSNALTSGINEQSTQPVAGAQALLLDYGSDGDDLIQDQENAYGCARGEPYTSRSEYDMFSWLASRHRKQPIQVFVQPSDNELIPRRGTGSNLPMAMKYRTLKETYKDYVGVFRSHIHGRGLYCTKDIEAGEMVIEYAGELIRSTLTDKRERYYDSRGIGCYMFKIDENLVVDATMRGNAARFINHSCEPNCYSKVVDILGHKHIIIFALRRIVQGEELTYDYKFPFEDEKIPCSCGSKRCRKYLN